MSCSQIRSFRKASLQSTQRSFISRSAYLATLGSFLYSNSIISSCGRANCAVFHMGHKHSLNQSNFRSNKHALLASLRFSNFTESIFTYSALQYLLPDDFYHRKHSQLASEIGAPNQEPASVQPYALGPTEVVYYCCNCGCGPFSWTRIQYCQNCHRLQCSLCDKKVIRK
jgi:hypothetical protein